MTHFCPLVPPISRAVAPPPAIVIQLVIRVISLHSDLTWVSSPSAGSGPWAPPSPWSGPSLPPPPCLSSSPPWAGPCSQRRCTSSSPAPGASPSHCQLQHNQRSADPHLPDLGLNSPISGGCWGPAGPEDLILLTGPCLGLSAVRLLPLLSGDAVPCLRPPGNSGDTLLPAPG